MTSFISYLHVLWLVIITMFRIKHCLISCPIAVLIAFVVIQFNHRYKDLPDFTSFESSLDEKTAGILLTNGKLLDRDWIKELYDHLLWYSPDKFNYSTFTKNVGQCTVQCHINGNDDTFFYEDNCRTNPILINDAQVPQNTRIPLDYHAYATIPCFLKVTESTIPRAGKGVFTTNNKIPKGYIFGPYGGVIVPYDSEEGKRIGENGYSWHVKTWTATHYIAAANEQYANWLRYINSARFLEEQNLIAIIINNTIYYMSFKDIEPNTELLVWYRFQYNSNLKIRVIKGSSYNTFSEYAPPLAETICPSCSRTEGAERMEGDDFDFDFYKFHINFLLKTLYTFFFDF